MNARELRQAAGLVLGNFSHPYGWSGMIEDSKLLAEHILATVRDDDDEAVDAQWICSFSKPMQYTSLWFNFDGYTVSVGPTGAKFHCNHMPFVSVKTRGQFRALCKGLGIELKEGE